MPFVWKLPNDPPDKYALDRMKQHFHKPSDLMPVAWFIGAEIQYYTWLAESPSDTLDPKLLAEAMIEIAGGIVAFPEVTFVSTWTAWFKHLLPYAIARADKGWGSDSVLVGTLTAFMSVYPQEIHEEYEGFREDVVQTLGTRVIPYIGSSDGLDFENVLDYPHTFPEDGPRIYDHFNFPMLFGLKYLTPSEIEGWAESIFGITNKAWRFAVIGWWLALNKFLQLAENWPQDGTLEQLLDVESGLISENGLVDSFWISRMRFASLDTFIPRQNLLTFQKALVQRLTFEVFQSWVTDITSHRTFTSTNGAFHLPEPYIEVIERFLTMFEQEFFHT